MEDRKCPTCESLVDPERWSAGYHYCVSKICVRKNYRGIRIVEAAGNKTGSSILATGDETEDVERRARNGEFGKKNSRIGLDLERRASTQTYGDRFSASRDEDSKLHSAESGRSESDRVRFERAESGSSRSVQRSSVVESVSQARNSAGSASVQLVQALHRQGLSPLDIQLKAPHLCLTRAQIIDIVTRLT